MPIDTYAVIAELMRTPRGSGISPSCPAEALEAIGGLGLHDREEALRDGVVTVAAAVHAADDAKRFQHPLVVLAGVRAALILVIRRPPAGPRRMSAASSVPVGV